MPNLQTLPDEARLLAKKAVLALRKMRLGLHAKQVLAFLSVATEILYGGAAGGGKSHLFRVAAIIWAKLIPGLQVYLFRREFPDLWKNHMEGPTSFPSLLAPLVEAGICKINYDKHFIKFTNGSTIHLCHCQHEKDKYGYQGAEIHLLIVEEVTQFTSSMYRYLRSRVRLGAMAEKIPEKYRHLFPRVICGGNPGGIGHNWVKATWIIFAPVMEMKKAAADDGGFLRQFIPARLEDNPTLLADPGYEDRLTGLGDPALVKAMRDGNWDIVAGGMFDDVYDTDRHELVPFPIPVSWRIDRSFHWGSSKPFSVGWWAESDGTEATLEDGTKKAWPRGTLFRIAEWYGWNGQPNEGCKMLAVEVAKGIKERETLFPWGPRVKPGPADNSIYDAENGVCIADDMAKLGIRWERSDKSPGSRKTGWEAMRRMFKAARKHPMEEPGLFVFNTCRDGFIRTVPSLVRDDKKTDDVDTAAEDHCLSGDTLVDTQDGQIPIKYLVGKCGIIKSHDGLLHEYIECKKTRANSSVVRVLFEDGRSIVCTDDHQFLAENGAWIEAKSLAAPTSQHILVFGDTKCSKLSAGRFNCFSVKNITCVGDISKIKGCDCIEEFGNITTEKSRKDSMFTTLMGIGQTTVSIISNCCLNRIMHVCTCLLPTGKNKAEGLLGLQSKLPQLGTRVKVGTNGIEHIMKSIRNLFTRRLNIPVNTAGRRSVVFGLGNIVRITANAMRGVILGSTTSLEHAPNVGKDLRSISMPGASSVADPALVRLRVVSVEPAGMEDVYCLRVPKTHSFTVNGGIVTHNCGDESRYRVLAVKRTASTRELRL